MSESQQIPATYHHQVTSKRADLTTLRACVSEFVRHFSPRGVALTLALALAARIYVGRWSWHDVLPPLALIAAQPFVEWVIHKHLLHLPPFHLLGRRFELYGSIQHRNHHRDPSDLRRVLLKPVEVVSFTIQIAILVAPIVWGLSALAGWDATPLCLTALVVAYAGLLRYEWCHFLIHTPYVPRSGWYRRIWRNHRLHHFKHEGYWLGVSSNLSDRVLRTNPDQRSVPRSPTARTLGVETAD
ncbi:MAG: sterol desaturase family protein [Solirubrobacteraceae bacterium]